MPFEIAAQRISTRPACSVILMCGLLAGCSTGEANSPADGLTSSTSLAVSQASGVLTIRDSTLGIGDTATIFFDGRALPSNVRRAAVSLQSSDSTILSIAPGGIAKGLRQGVANITARSLSGRWSLQVSIATASPSPTPPAPPAAPPQAPTPEPPAGALPTFVAPQLPQQQVGAVNATFRSTRVRRIAAGDVVGLQNALNTAVAGDEIVLADRGVYRGTFVLPRRADAGMVVVRSETVPTPEGSRVTPARAASHATLVATSVYPSLTTGTGAQGWRVIAVSFRVADGNGDNYGIVRLGTGAETALSQFPRDIVLDRVLVSGNTSGSTSRCVALNGAGLAVINSWLAECHAVDRDAQAIGGWTGTGPYLIENNYLEGSGQAIMFGGSDPLISGVVPADITVRRNHLFRPLTWARKWLVKAAFELKSAERLLFEGNVIENQWSDGQIGFAILLKSASQDNRAPWSIVRDITIRNNAIRNARNGANVLARESATVQPARRILFQNNSFESVGRDPINGGGGIFFQSVGEHEDVTVLQNTFYGTDATMAVSFDMAPARRMLVVNNVFAATTYGVKGSGYSEGNETLKYYAPTGPFRNNILPSRPAAAYPMGNAFPATLPRTAFIDPANGNFGLKSQAGLALFDATRTGVDGASVLAAIAGVIVR